MNKLLNKKIHFFILALSTALLPHSVFASTVYVDTKHSDFFVGDTVLYSVHINSENKNINAVEGEVLLDYPANVASLTDINISGSALSLWPDKPSPSENNTSISFAGGLPGGFASKDAIVFNIVLKLQEIGQITLTPHNIGVYLHDGKGTKDAVSVKNLVINVLPKKTDVQSADDWSIIVSKDKVAPESFDVTLGKDPSVFDNHYFISFFTTDAESGVAYYEVQEGERDFVRAESQYVLQDQSLKNVIKVKAIDKAGNERLEKLMPPTPTVLLNKNILFWILVCVIIIVRFYVFWRKFRRKVKI